MRRALAALAAAALVALILAIASAGRAPRRFADSEGYLWAAAQPLDLEFFSSARPPFELRPEPALEDGLYRNRPWLVPLLYRACALEPGRIVLVQTLLYALGAGVGIALLLSAMRGAGAAATALGGACLGAIALAWYLSGWTGVLLSEALVLALAWVAAGGVASYLAAGGRTALALATGASAALLFARDSGGLLALPLFAAAAVAAAVARERTRARRLALAALALLPLFALAHGSATRGHRALLPIANVVLVRVAPDPDALAWWRARGLPWNAELDRFAGGFAFADDLELFRSPRHAELLSFLETRGPGLLALFLLTQPDYLLRETRRGWSDLFGTDLSTYVGPPPALLAPIDAAIRAVGAAGAGLILALSALLLVRGRLRGVRPGGGDLAPFVLATAFFLHGLAALHADAAEPERHCFPTTFGLQIAAATALGGLAARVRFARAAPGGPGPA